MKIAIKGVIVLFLLAAIWLLVKEFDGVRFKTESYENAIDSLAVQIDSLHGKNDSLEATIQVVEQENLVLEQNTKTLTGKVKELKEDKSELEAAAKMRPHEIDSFFVVRYAEQYKVETKDTTILPVPVSKAVVVDLVDLDRTRNIVLNQDSLITNLESTVNGKDKVIVTLRTKEGNYESIIQKQVQQQDNYKIMVEGLKGDIKKLDRKNKINKLTKFGMGFLILGLAVTHK
jgi:DNA repair exonuclease SbcCD ATPase subunit